MAITYLFQHVKNDFVSFYCKFCLKKDYNCRFCLFKIQDEMKLNKVITTLSEYMDKNDDSSSIANFLLQNLFLLNPNLIEFTKFSMQAWKILMELLLEVDNNSNKIAIEIILNLYNLTQPESSKLNR
jgi:hypothetical protein